MPVTAKLSRRFYERFGDELTNELVDWFNSVDATYHSDLRELNDLNFARFDAKLDQRVASIESKIDGLEARMESRLVASEAKTEQRFVERFADFESRVIRWMVGLWTGTMLAFVGLILAVLRSK